MSDMLGDLIDYHPVAFFLGVCAIVTGMVIAAMVFWPEQPCPGASHVERTLIMVPVGKVLVPNWIDSTVCDS